MTDKQRYYKLDDVRVIGNQTEETKNSKKYHALKTSRFFKALKEEQASNKNQLKKAA